TANGNIVQLIGTTIQTGGAISCTIGTNNRDVSLFNTGNRIAGAVTVAETGANFIRDVSLRNISDTALPPTGTPLTPARHVRHINLFFDHNGVVLPAYNISNNLVVTAGGDISQNAALTIGGNATFTVLGDFAIDLSTATNDFSGSVSLNAPQSTQQIQVADS